MHLLEYEGKIKNIIFAPNMTGLEQLIPLIMPFIYSIQLRVIDYPLNFNFGLIQSGPLAGLTINYKGDREILGIGILRAFS